MILTTSMAHAKREAEYVAEDCQGDIEVRLHDGTRVDCLTDTHAIEYDWSRKWYQALGQSLHYARMTGLKPGIVIIQKHPKDEKYFRRLQAVINYYGLPVDARWIKE